MHCFLGNDGGFVVVIQFLFHLLINFNGRTSFNFPWSNLSLNNRLFHFQTASLHINTASFTMTDFQTITNFGWMTRCTKFGWRRLVTQLIYLLKERRVLHLTINIDTGNDIVQSSSLNHVWWLRLMSEYLLFILLLFVLEELRLFLNYWSYQKRKNFPLRNHWGCSLGLLLWSIIDLSFFTPDRRNWISVHSFFSFLASD